MGKSRSRNYDRRGTLKNLIMDRVCDALVIKHYRHTNYNRHEEKQMMFQITKRKTQSYCIHLNEKKMRPSK